MSDAYIAMNTAEFNEALNRYRAAGKKEFADALNHQMGNWLIKASEIVRMAMSSAITSLVAGGGSAVWWWNRYLRKVMRNTSSPYMLKVKLRTKGYLSTLTWKDRSSGQVMTERRTMTTYVQAGMRKGDLYRLSQSIIKRRVARVGSLRAMLKRVAYEFALKGWGLAGATKAQKYTTVNSRIVHATDANPTARFELPYKGFPRETGEGDVAARAARQAQLCGDAMTAAVPIVIADMEVYIQKKLQAQADRYSARMAA